MHWLWSFFIGEQIFPSGHRCNKESIINESHTQEKHHRYRFCKKDKMYWNRKLTVNRIQNEWKCLNVFKRIKIEVYSTSNGFLACVWVKSAKQADYFPYGDWYGNYDFWRKRFKKYNWFLPTVQNGQICW